MVSLDSVWAGCPYALWYVVALTITLYQSDPACHYLVVCNVVRGLRSYGLIVEAVRFPSWGASVYGSLSE